MTIEAQGPPSVVSVARAPVTLAARIVRASSAALRLPRGRDLDQRRQLGDQLLRGGSQPDRDRVAAEVVGLRIAGGALVGAHRAVQANRF